jgi:uncharacterized protein YecE (DUF72 family)
MIRVGTCSWTEKSLIRSKEFYPKGINTAEERLRYYSEKFDVVEVDSSFYAIPSEKTASLWTERTPPGFVFHIKAFALLTGHSADLKAVPPDVRDLLPIESLARNRVIVKEKKPLEAAFRLFRAACEPLRQAGKMGIVVFQYPPFLIYKKQNFDYILFCRDMMEGFRIGIEFRHGSWLTPDNRDSVFGFLREHQLTYIAADEPQYGTLATVPFIPGITTDVAYFRFHGRNKENWLKRGLDTSLRYDYLYPDRELREFIPPLSSTNQKAKVTYAMFNNCHGASATRNATRLKEMVKTKDQI